MILKIFNYGDIIGFWFFRDIIGMGGWELEIIYLYIIKIELFWYIYIFLKKNNNKLNKFEIINLNILY